MRTWRKKREGLELEAELRANRPEPSRELLHRLEASVRQDGRRSRSGSFRVAFAGALAAGLLTALASVGGLSYAATGASQAMAKAKSVVHAHAVAQIHQSQSAARDQYSKPKAKCRKGTRRVKGVCKRVKRARGVRFRRPPFTG
jgi:cytochrome c-type biogenesis protein CcmH/NrfG